jgi:hypothetical protein
MTTFTHRVIGAARLESRVYEEVEADSRATRQSVALVLLAGLAGGIGLLGFGGVQGAWSVVTGVIAALVGWMAWAMLTYLIGTRLLPEPQTSADFGQLLRTLAFASSPGLLRALGVIPFLGLPIYAIASVWMLVAMIVAVRQALDFSSTGRAVAVCVVGWALSLALAAVAGIFFTSSVS